MYRNVNNGELRKHHVGKNVVMCGWVHRSRDLGGMTFIDLRDRYGITQLVFDSDLNESMLKMARHVSREYVIQIKGCVVNRAAINKQISTGQVEVRVTELTILNKSKTPPFTIEDDTDGGDELRMKYRYLDLRRNIIRDNLIFRSEVSFYTRKYLRSQSFLEIETPMLIKSTPEGARDFIVPSRLNQGDFYALPQSPQTFKQLLMVSGYDKYYQIVKCFRDEDLRADRQPEFTQIDCEMSFVDQEDVLNTFEGLIKNIFFELKGISFESFPRITYQEAISRYGTDKPDLRFEIKINNLTSMCKGSGFGLFDNSEVILGIVVPGGVKFSRKEIDSLTEWVKRPQIGSSGMIFCKFNEDNSCKSSVDKFFDSVQLNNWKGYCRANKGDLLLILAGPKTQTYIAMGNLRLEVAERLNLREPGVFKPVWITDFPLFQSDEGTGRLHAMHHPFTSPNIDDLELLNTDPSLARAEAYDLAINGVEIGGGSIRIHNKKLQTQIFKLLGMDTNEANEKFGFLMDAFEYGAPPHGGIAFGLDRLCAVLSNCESIRDFIPFPKNNSGRDVMLDAPSTIDSEQLIELNLKKT